MIPSSSSLIMKALDEPVRDRKKVKNVVHSGNLTLDAVIEIARAMRERSISRKLAGTVKEILGTCNSIGCTVNEESPRDIQSGSGFVGYCVHANGITFPWNIQTGLDQTSITANLPTISFADISAAGAPGDMWDALPTAAKVQIILVVGFLEMHGENSLALEADGQKHYVRGGKPGY